MNYKQKKELLQKYKTSISKLNKNELFNEMKLREKAFSKQLEHNQYLYFRLHKKIDSIYTQYLNQMAMIATDLYYNSKF